MAESIRVLPSRDRTASAAYLAVLPGLTEMDLGDPTELYSIDGRSYEVGEPLAVDVPDAREWQGKLVVARPIDTAGTPLPISRRPQPEEDRVRWKFMDLALIQQEITTNRTQREGFRFSPQVGRLAMVSTTMRNVELLSGTTFFTGFYRTEARTPTHAIYPVLHTY